MTDQRTRQSGTEQAEIVPAARVDDLVLTETGGEVLVYDQQRHHIHLLNHTSAVVWRLCNGRRTVEEIARLASVELGSAIDANVIHLAVTKLATAHLLNEPVVRHAGQDERRLRRAFSRRATIKGAIALPVIASITAPTAAMAASNCPSGYLGPNDCKDGYAGCPCGQPRDNTVCKQMFGSNWFCTAD